MLKTGTKSVNCKALLFTYLPVQFYDKKNFFGSTLSRIFYAFSTGTKYAGKMRKKSKKTTSVRFILVKSQKKSKKLKKRRTVLSTPDESEN
jgi:hypothetical protein